MGLSRESYNLFSDIKNKNWSRVKLYLKLFFTSKNSRRFIILDSFITPFHKKIGCKISGHLWSTQDEILKYDLDQPLCWRCGKRTTKHDLLEHKIDSLLN